MFAVITLLKQCELKWNVDNHVYLIQLSGNISMHAGSPTWNKPCPGFFGFVSCALRPVSKHNTLVGRGEANNSPIWFFLFNNSKLRQVKGRAEPLGYISKTTSARDLTIQWRTWSSSLLQNASNRAAAILGMKIDPGRHGHVLKLSQLQ